MSVTVQLFTQWVDTVWSDIRKGIWPVKTCCKNPKRFSPWAYGLTSNNIFIEHHSIVLYCHGC